MIPITRIQEPKVLKKNWGKWTLDYLAAIKAYTNKKTAKNLKKKNNSERKYNKREVRDALISMCNGKCVYCESHVIHIEYPHIEHFRPKSRFPRRCFEWDNMFLACAICNGKEYKSNKWPTAKNGNGPLVDPEIEDPNDFFEFKFDAKTGVSEVKPKNKRGVTTEKILGLNRLTLLKHRNSVVKKLAYIALQAKNGDVLALSHLKESMRPCEEYSAFAKAFFKKYKLK